MLSEKEKEDWTIREYKLSLVRKLDNSQYLVKGSLSQNHKCLTNYARLNYIVILVHLSVQVHLSKHTRLHADSIPLKPLCVVLFDSEIIIMVA